MDNFRIFKYFRTKFLEHLTFLEDPEYCYDGSQHKGKGDYP